MARLTEGEIKVIRDACLSKFKYFAQTFITHFGTFERYYPPFHDRLCDFLQDSPGKDKLVILARSTLKTTICTILFPLWKATCDTNTRWLLAGNSEDNARNNVHAIKGIVEKNKLYAALFSDCIPNFGKDRWSDSGASLNRTLEHPNCTFESAGVGTNITGCHPTDIIEDDTVTPKKDQMTQQEMMPTRDDIEKAVGFHKLTLPLLDNPNRGQRIFVCTRWASYDAAHYIMENESNPKNGRHYEVYDEPVRDRETGALTYPSFYNESTLKTIKSSMGSFMYQMLYENNPLSSEFMKIRPEWIRYFYTDKEGNFVDKKTGDVVREVGKGRKMVTVDAADPPGEKSAGQCYSVGMAAVNSEAGLFIDKYVRGKWSDVQLAKRCFNMGDERGYTRYRIEKDRYPHMKNTFKIESNKREGKRHSIEECSTRGRRKDEDRIMRIAALAEDGLLWIRVNMNELENEMYTWPNGTTDDLVDAAAWHVLDDFKVPHKAVSDMPDDEYNDNTFTLNDILKTMPNCEASKEYGLVTSVTEDRWGS